jgi:hypothetical protein
VGKQNEENTVISIRNHYENQVLETGAWFGNGKTTGKTTSKPSKEL